MVNSSYSPPFFIEKIILDGAVLVVACKAMFWVDVYVHMYAFKNLKFGHENSLLSSFCKVW